MTAPETTEDVRCLDESAECEGAVEYRHPLSGTGRSHPRCDHHWNLRLDLQAGLNRRYPDQAAPPPWFDTLAAGERWDEED